MVKFCQHNNNINLIRGDTGLMQINFSQEVDTAVFSVKKNINDSKYVIQKDIVDGMLKIEHSDTNKLDAGKYIYDIQVTYGDVVDTPLIGEFTVIADVTRE